jgi:hypothetical protein
MLDVRIKMRSGGCVAFSQNTGTDTGGGVVRRFDPRSATRGPVGLDSMGVLGDLGPCSMWQDLRAIEGLLFGYNDL